LAKFGTHTQNNVPIRNELSKPKIEGKSNMANALKNRKY